MGLKSKIKYFIPEKFISFYHFCLAVCAAFYYGRPSKKMVVIGITGTKGKTSTANFIWSVLNSAGYKTGLVGTANIRIGDVEILNKYHMTMPGRFVLQKFLKEMVAAGCGYCVVETTSQGIKQWRHYGIVYDIAIFTNLSPEHLESHGGFEEYKAAKGKLFAALANGGYKIIGGRKIEKIIIANYDNSHKDYYLNFGADKKITFGLSGGDFMARNIKNIPAGLEFYIDSYKYVLNIFGRYNAYNALPAIIVGSVFGISRDKIADGLRSLKVIPGRMEKIDEGQDFLVFVDYAHEKQSMTAALVAARELIGEEGKSSERAGKVVVLFGSEGGGRDKAKRYDLAEVAAKMANFLIITSTDPYEENPKELCEEIAKTAEKFGKTKNENLFAIEDRRKGIAKALSLAGKNDVVLIAGKGAEQSMIVGEKHIPWDDRIVVREELSKILRSQN
ncbi:UDP-N-acetylmuramoyl-L-alanyl-D-glutamate--2,6-diaminopimelate ligase [Candidatus Azambacteria bacterium]|nr:UDP-N-acetylmuramoyl-L-alanyl-D-glutamate--2,6-diaminopimelate ligase [Candidatus Azambacteria bacterium]